MIIHNVIRTLISFKDTHKEVEKIAHTHTHIVKQSNYLLFLEHFANDIHSRCSDINNHISLRRAERFLPLSDSGEVLKGSESFRGCAVNVRRQHVD